MQRRPFLFALAAAAAGTAVAEPTEAVDVRKFVADFYRAYSSGSAEQYRKLLAPDYLLLENGTVFDADQDVASMPAAGVRRSDDFEFRQVHVADDVAYAVYLLRSVITDAKGTRNKAWVESVVLRGETGSWRMALLHSTVLAAEK